MTELLYNCHRLGLQAYGVLVRSWRVVRRLCGPEPRPCHLLDLPVEVRMRIWEYAVGGQYIAFYEYEGRGRLTHGLLNEAHMRTPGRLLPYSSYDVDDDILFVTGKPLDIDAEPRGVHHFPHKGKHLTGLVKSCRLIYSEAIDLLYSANTFVFLQNPALAAFRKVIATKHFLRIRKIHIHWQIRENGRLPLRLSSWNKEPFRASTAALIAGMYHLQQLSVYVQGPLWRTDWYKNFLKDMVNGVARPKFFAVRLGWPILDDSEEAGNYPGFTYSTNRWIEQLERDIGGHVHMRLCRPVFERGKRNWHSAKDDDLGCGYPLLCRVGALFEPGTGDHDDDVVVTSYVVGFFSGYEHRKKSWWAD